jgi:hypothetical protein
VRVDLLAVALLETEHHLHRREGRCAVVERANELLVRRDRELCGVLELLSLVSIPWE